MNAEFGIKLEGGPLSGQRFHLHSLREQVLAARRMGRFNPWADPAARILGYLPAGRDFWIWRGFNCHRPRVDVQVAIAGIFPSEPVAGEAAASRRRLTSPAVGPGGQPRRDIPGRELVDVSGA